MTGMADLTKGQVDEYMAGLSNAVVKALRVFAEHGPVITNKELRGAGVSGMLLRYGDTFGILYAIHISSVGYQRFSIAHELGHYFLDGHAEQLLPQPDSVHHSRAGFASDDVIEREADYFASGLLMPTALFEREMRRRDDGLEAIIELSELCLSPLTATAIRYADLCRGALAEIVSNGNKIEFAILSEGIKSLKDITWLRKGSAIPAGTLTVRFNADPQRVQAAGRQSDNIDISSWLSGRSVLGREEVIGLGAYGRTLTVLTCSIRDETYDDEQDEDEALLESWTPRFRR